jgi:hypothetical protein
MSSPGTLAYSLNIYIVSLLPPSLSVSLNIDSLRHSNSSYSQDAGLICTPSDEVHKTDSKLTQDEAVLLGRITGPHVQVLPFATSLLQSSHSIFSRKASPFNTLGRPTQRNPPPRSRRLRSRRSLPSRTRKQRTSLLQQTRRRTSLRG